MKRRIEFKQTETRKIPEGWQQFKMGDLIDVKHGFAFKGEFFSDVPSANILLTPGNFKLGGGFKGDKLKYYHGEYPHEYVLKEDDIIITMTDLSKNGDTLGYPAKVPVVKGKRYLHNQRLGLVIFKSRQIDRDFLYWIMREKKYQRFIVNSASGSTVKHTAPNRIKEYEFFVPVNIPEQRAIAKILSDLDAKIEVNRKMNATLEEIAQAIFRRWFVDFEFPNKKGMPYKSSGGKMVNSETEFGEIPTRWEVARVSDVMSLEYGKALKEENRQQGSIPVYGSNGQVGWHNAKLVDGPGIIIGRKGNPGIVTWVQTDFFPIDTTFYVVPKGIMQNIHYLFYSLNLQNLVSLGADSAVPGLNRNIVYMNNMLIPQTETLNKFECAIKPFFKKMQENEEESIRLSQIRDSLLPRLMSGKIRVN